MKLFASAPLVGAYVCPRGVFVVVGKRVGAGIQVGRTLEVPAELASPYEAADLLIRVLRSAEMARATLTLAVRGFGVVHHVLQMPPARDELLSPIIEREIRRLEPQLGDSVVHWMALPALDSEGGPQRSILAAAVPRDVVQIFEERLGAAGYRVRHFTPLAAAMQRLLEEFDAAPGTSALVAPLPDGAFIGFALNGGVRLVVEPPLPQDAEHELPALGEEIELGAMFVRQQFRGAQIDRVMLVGTKDSLSDAEAVLTERLHVPVKRLGIEELSPSAIAALGGLLDAEAAKPLSLGGASGPSAARSASPLATAAIAAVALFVVVATWTVVETARAKRASMALEAARRQIEHESFGLASVRSTADQRKLIRDAVAALRLVGTDRAELQQTLSGISAMVRPPVRLDSLTIVRSDAGWTARMLGSVSGITNARAVQSLHDVYRELPQRLALDSLKLDELGYADSTASESGSALVRFQLSFLLPSARKD